MTDFSDAAPSSPASAEMSGPQTWQPPASDAVPSSTMTFNPRQMLQGQTRPNPPQTGQMTHGQMPPTARPHPQPQSPHQPQYQPLPQHQPQSQLQSTQGPQAHMHPAHRPAYQPPQAQPYNASPSPAYGYAPPVPAQQNQAPQQQPYIQPPNGYASPHLASAPAADPKATSLIGRLLKRKTKSAQPSPSPTSAPAPQPQTQQPTRAADRPAKQAGARTPFLAGMITGMALMFLGSALLGGGEPEPVNYALEPFAEAAPATGTFLDSVTSEQATP